MHYKNIRESLHKSSFSIKMEFLLFLENLSIPYNRNILFRLS